MRQENWKRLYSITDFIHNKVNVCLIIVACIPLSPFIAIKFAIDDHRKKKRERKLAMQRYIDEAKPKVHVTPDKNGICYIQPSSVLRLPFDKVVYVESEPDETIDKFFSENKEWIAKWRDWYGLEIVQISKEEIRSSLLYPQDFQALHHGFLLRTPFNDQYSMYYELRSKI